jgi:5S rRNA maturation endonuclease (ribonuclease M5)
MQEKKLTKKTLLKYVSDYEIFKKYWKRDFQLGVMYMSPIRNEDRPSFNVFRHYNGNLLFKDFAGEIGDCFRFVATLKNIKVNDALALIAEDFDVKLDEENFERTPEIVMIGNKERSLIEIRIQPFQLKDVMYWDQYGITGKTLKKYGIVSLEKFKVNGSKWFENGSNHLIYGFIFDDSTKIYKPLDSNGYKWISNCSSKTLQGYDQLPLVGDKLVITKSLKDVCALDEFNVPSIAPHGETVGLSEEIIKDLKKRFREILVLYDPDKTGYTHSEKLCERWGLKRFFVQSKACIWKKSNTTYGSVKDFSDFRCEFGEEAAIKLLKRIQLI